MRFVGGVQTVTVLESYKFRYKRFTSIVEKIDSSGKQLFEIFQGVRFATIKPGYF